MLKEERRRQITDILRSSGRIEINELVKIFGVTNMTIRRDLDELERLGVLSRSRGGALLSDADALVEHPFSIRETENSDRKRAVAAAAAATIIDGRKIFIGSGTTVLHLAQKLHGSRRLIVVTDAINIAAELITRPGISVIQIGGDLRPNTYSTVGAFAEDMVRKFKCQQAYIGVTGVGPDGSLYVASVAEAGLYRALFEVSRNIYILADSKKIGTEDFVSIGLLQPGHTLVTDSGADPALLISYRSFGAEVIVAEV